MLFANRSGQVTLTPPPIGFVICNAPKVHVFHVPYVHAPDLDPTITVFSKLYRSLFVELLLVALLAWLLKHFLFVFSMQCGSVLMNCTWALAVALACKMRMSYVTR